MVNIYPNNIISSTHSWNWERVIKFVIPHLSAIKITFEIIIECWGIISMMCSIGTMTPTYSAMIVSEGIITGWICNCWRFLAFNTWRVSVIISTSIIFCVMCGTNCIIVNTILPNCVATFFDTTNIFFFSHIKKIFFFYISTFSMAIIPSIKSGCIESSIMCTFIPTSTTNFSGEIWIII